MTKLILGDNSFFGVNHSSFSGAAPQETINSVCTTAKENGVDTLMISPHPGYEQVLQKLPVGFKLAIVVPYPHRLNDLIVALGYLGFLKTLGLTNLISFFGSNILNFLCGRRFGNYESIFGGILDLEEKLIAQTQHKVEFACLHNIVVDLLVACGRVEVLDGFIKACRMRNLSPVLITQNLPAVLHVSLDAIVCATINPNGYMMNPTQAAVEAAVKDTQVPIWAMQVLSSGKNTPGEANAYLKHFDSLVGVLFSTTKQKNVESFINEVVQS